MTQASSPRLLTGSRLDEQIRSLGMLSLGGGEHDGSNAASGGTASPATNYSLSEGENLRPGSSNSTTSKADGGGPRQEQDDEAGQQILLLYKWLDTLPLPSIKRSSGIVARDFSDGTAVADIIHYYFPTYVERHNYVKSSNSSRKKANWEVLVTKVLLKREPFKRTFGGLASSKVRAAEVDALCAGVTGRDGRNTALEGFLWKLMRCCLGQAGGVVAVSGVAAVGQSRQMRQALADVDFGNTGAPDRAGAVGHGERATCTSEEDEDEDESQAGLIQALVDENTNLSNMVIKQDGIIRLMQAKISTLERELGL
jgi:hypothetical protein